MRMARIIVEVSGAQGEAASAAGARPQAAAGGGRAYCAVQPPSMEKLAPFAEAPRSETR
jgi:hypothetical protein